MNETIAAWAAVGAGVIALAAFVVAILARGDSKRSSREAKRSADAANEANAIARKSKAVADKANELAEGANRIAETANRIATESVAVAGDSKQVAEAANELAVQANALAERANGLAVDSNTIAGEALEVSRDSAVSARESARAAELTAKLDRDARHDLYAPVRPAAIRTWLQADSHAGASLFGEITVGRDYRMSAIGRYDTNSTYDIAHGRLVRANVPTKFALETWPPDRTEPETVEVEFRFWPALPREGVDGWGCPCDKEPEHPEGHWRFTVPIEPPPKKRVDAEWQAHLARRPSHLKNDTLVPSGWMCLGDSNESCDAKSSSLS